jgi:hypothetical protein
MQDSGEGNNFIVTLSFAALTVVITSMRRNYKNTGYTKVAVYFQHCFVLST